MSAENLIVFCLKCGRHFKEVEVSKLAIISGFEGQETPKNLHICKTCYAELPETDEVRKMEVMK